MVLAALPSPRALCIFKGLQVPSVLCVVPCLGTLQTWLSYAVLVQHPLLWVPLTLGHCHVWRHSVGQLPSFFRAMACIRQGGPDKGAWFGGDGPSFGEQEVRFPYANPSTGLVGSGGAIAPSLWAPS